jgi:hypothetical protein
VNFRDSRDVHIRVATTAVIARFSAVDIASPYDTFEALARNVRYHNPAHLDPAMGSRLHNAPIVIDNGSGTIRAGFAGEDVPKCYFPSYVGRPKHVRTMAGALEGDVFIGPQAQQYRGLFKINYPLEHGIVTDWDDMERIWQYVYQEGLKTVSEDVSEAIGGVWWGQEANDIASSTPSSSQNRH